MATWASLTKGTKAQQAKLRAALHYAKKRRLERKAEQEAAEEEE
jgi:hypothetical protein